MYSQSYSESYALVIGINRYQHCGPLGYAVQDAEAIAEVLKEKFGFNDGNLTLLTDEEATKEKILKNYMRLCQEGSNADDRVIVFFAGHGHTEKNRKREVGFLVPVDGDPYDLSSLLRWDELTRNADLINAKHMFFIMDACYGGLAITRAIRPGSMRFIRDMMQRPARQVLTAGKADEVVADLGGPLAGHSVFTGYLLKALNGAACDNAGNLTAAGITAYVYQSVGADESSSQTPHFGHLQGDGDMVFNPIFPSESTENTPTSEDVLFSVPAVLKSGEHVEVDNLTELKELLSENKNRIQLHDFISQHTREILSATSADYFPLKGELDNASFVERLHKYEEAILPMIPQEMLLGRWSISSQRESMCMPLKRLTERIEVRSGTTHLLHSRWYPILLLMYAAGIGCIADANYENLYSIFHMPVSDRYDNVKSLALIAAISRPIAEISDRFKAIPEYSNMHAARSEYIYKYLQPIADDTLFLGVEYEAVFDRFELLMALEFAHLNAPEKIDESTRVWGPVGRFSWKESHESGPIYSMTKEADSSGSEWPPLLSGFFSGSQTRFKTLVTKYRESIIKMGWGF